MCVPHGQRNAEFRCWTENSNDVHLVRDNRGRFFPIQVTLDLQSKYIQSYGVSDGREFKDQIERDNLRLRGTICSQAVISGRCAIIRTSGGPSGIWYQHPAGSF